MTGDEALAAVERVERLCKEWDLWTKGESPTTKRIRETMYGVSGNDSTE